MKVGTGGHFEQAYNAQAAVEIDSRLIVAARVTTAPNDKEQLVTTVQAVPATGARASDGGVGGQRILQRASGRDRGSQRRPERV
ncbi:MAG: hypothetical protein WCS70_12260 [Verrucomicrobiota bacterium]